MKSGKRNFFSRLILEKIAEAGELALDGLFPQNRVEGKIWRSALGLPGSYKFSRSNFSFILSQLNKQGLIRKTGGRRQARWSLTDKGEKKIGSANDFMEPAQPDGIPRLVMYDIPESEKGKRNLIRNELVACGYDQLQKSVWIGYSPLPEVFLKSLNDLRLNGKVHIVSIHKQGTIGIF